jgi:hypothetical protein
MILYGTVAWMEVMMWLRKGGVPEGYGIAVVHAPVGRQQARTVQAVAIQRLTASTCGNPWAKSRATVRYWPVTEPCTLRT